MLVVTIELFHFSVDNGHLRAAKNTLEAFTEIFFDLFFVRSVSQNCSSIVEIIQN